MAPEGFVAKINSLEKEKDQVALENEFLKRRIKELENRVKLAEEIKSEEVEADVPDYDTANMHFFPRDIAGHTTSIIDCILYALSDDVEHFDDTFRRKSVSLKKFISSKILMDDNFIKNLNLKGKTPEHFCDMFEYTPNSPVLI